MVDAEQMGRDIGDPAIAPLFTRRFVEASERFDELVDAAAWQILGSLGALPQAKGQRLDEAAASLGLVPASAGVFSFLHRKLADAGFLSAEDGVFTSTGKVPEPFADLAARFAAVEPDAAVGAEIVGLLVEEAGAFFRGEKSGEEILFSPIRLPLWFRYFSNANLLYGINNALGAEVLARHLPQQGASVLEVGGGAGSAAEAALKRAGTQIGR